jgi:phytoene/squalene synthetase
VSDLILTPEEIKNGWTISTLQAYFDQREREQSKHVLAKKVHKPNTQKSKYNPHKWRG